MFKRIKSDRLVARREKNKEVSSILTTLIGEIESDVIGNTKIKEITDDVVIAKIKKFSKSLNELLSKLDKDSPAAELPNYELKILNSYLPSQLTEDELRAIIIDSGLTNIGEIMKMLKSNHSGLFDGKMASSIIKEL